MAISYRMDQIDSIPIADPFKIRFVKAASDKVFDKMREELL